MFQKRILIIHPSPTEADRLALLARKFGTVVCAPDPESALTAFAEGDLVAAVVDASLARSPDLLALIRPPIGVLITGADEDELSRAADAWPQTVDTDICPTSPTAPRDRAFVRTLARIVEHARLKIEASGLRRSLGLQEVKVKDVLGEISEIKGLLNAGFLREVEKRLAIEARYVGSQKERRRFESILLRIYGADDVSSLLDIVPEIRDIVQAASVSVYILEENDVLGRYLKPLVWDNALLTHSDFSKYIATLEAQDFAASVARYGHDINVANLTFDRRLSRRYTTLLKAAPRSLLGVPVMHGPKVIGVLEVTNKTVAGQAIAEGFSREDQQILRGLSDHMAIAMAKLNLIQYDALTGLLRPEPFFEKILQKVNSLSKRRREEGAMALVMGDVDWFKVYNDRNGQEAGNRLLRELGHVLKLAIREEDLICRYGGEEFLFFLLGVKGVDEAALLTERIRKSVEDHYFELQEYQPRGNLTMSFGVTVFPKSFGEQTGLMTRAELKRLAGEADLALAEAKGKARPELRQRGSGEPSGDKNRVSSFVGQEAGADGKSRAQVRNGLGAQEKRKLERYHVSTPFLYRDNGGFKVAKTVNIGLEGARIVSDTPFGPGPTYDSILVIEDRATPVKCTLVYSEKGVGDPGFYYTGVKFEDLTMSEIKGLERYLLNFRRRDAVT
jgi:diguanylate cyclase (GGDEF)-like protein